MKGPTPSHPSDRILTLFGLGHLDDKSAGAITKHLEHCSECRRRIAESSADSPPRGGLDASDRPASSAPVVSPASGLSKIPAVPESPAPPPLERVPAGLADHPDYRILRELGQGGMGVVYLAENTIMGRKEVLKIVRSHMLKRRGVLERFFGEIRSAARLHHPNVVTAYAVLRLGDTLVLAMEYVEGLDMARVVKSYGPLPVARACYFVQQAAQGLQHAYENGMVHRDIKPGNLMLTNQGDRALVKLLDFGLAKVISEEPTDGELTHEGQMLGTPDYIAPEQITDARRADIRADIYSLGCTLYYLLTGKPPFHAASLYELLQAHHSMDAMPLSRARQDVPAELAALVARMMAKDPADRFQTPKDVAQALRPFFKVGSAATSVAKPEDPRPDASSTDRPAIGPFPDPRETARVVSPIRPAATAAATAGDAELYANVNVPIASPTPGAMPRPPWWTWPVIAGASLLGLIALSVIIHVATDNGRIKILVDGPQPTVTIDDEAVRVERLAEPITLRAGPHQLEVRWSDGMSTTRLFVVRRGDNRDVPITYEPRRGPDNPPRPPVADTKVAQQAGPTDRPPPARAEPPSPPPSRPSPGKVEPPKPPVPPPPREVTNKIGMKLTLIPPGEFLMGSADDDTQARDWEKPQHRVRITRPFYLGVCEVTQAEYGDVMGRNPSRWSSNRGAKGRLFGESTGVFPVENVSWIDAVQFCNALSARENRKPFYGVNGENVRILDPMGSGYRLPTEAEWEYACRAGGTSRYYVGGDPTSVARYAWFRGNSQGRPHPVGLRSPNALGLYDMFGNVWEWCEDTRLPYDRSSGNVTIDPHVLRNDGWRAHRGAAYQHDPHVMLERGSNPTTFHAPDVGFRVARSHDPGE